MLGWFVNTTDDQYNKRKFINTVADIISVLFSVFLVKARENKASYEVIKECDSCMANPDSPLIHSS